jgi:hypothetical protein
MSQRPTLAIITQCEFTEYRPRKNHNLPASYGVAPAACSNHSRRLCLINNGQSANDFFFNSTDLSFFFRIDTQPQLSRYPARPNGVDSSSLLREVYTNVPIRQSSHRNETKLLSTPRRMECYSVLIYSPFLMRGYGPFIAACSTYVKE